MYSLEKAMNELSGESFKLWIYFSKNQDKYSFDLSPKDVEKWGISRSTFYRIKDEFIEKGYLQQKQQGSNIYYFTETPFSQIGKEREEIEEEKEMVISQYGKNYSQNGKDFSGNETNFSHFEQRNNINNTNKIKDNKIKKSDKVAKNNLDFYCIDILEEIEKDNEKGKFNEKEQYIIKQLSDYLHNNCRTETTENLYNEILSVYGKLYIK